VGGTVTGTVVGGSVVVVGGSVVVVGNRKPPLREATMAISLGSPASVVEVVDDVGESVGNSWGFDPEQEARITATTARVLCFKSPP
jgi:hypothetical protein